MTVVGVVAAFTVMILLDIPVIMKTNNRLKTALIYFFITWVGMAISILQLTGKTPPRPSQIIEELIKLILPGV